MNTLAKVGRLLVVVGLAMQLAGVRKQRTIPAPPQEPARTNPPEDVIVRCSCDLATLDGRLTFRDLSQLAWRFGAQHRAWWH